MGTVLCELDYGMDLANFILGKHSLNLPEMPISGKMFSLAETHGLSPAGANLTFRVETGELAIVEQHCLIPLVVNFVF